MPEDQFSFFEIELAAGTGLDRALEPPV